MPECEISILTDGYFIEPSVLSDLECEALLASLIHPKRGRAGARHLMRHPAIARLAADGRLLVLARRVLGGRAVPFRATLFEKSAAANWLFAWHQDHALPLTARFDAPGWGPWSEKGGILDAHAPSWALSRVVALRVHLDASTTDNGPLRVIPTSHCLGVLTDAQVLDFAKAHDPTEYVVHRGGVIAMRPLIIHSSSKARAREASASASHRICGFVRARPRHEVGHRLTSKLPLPKGPSRISRLGFSFRW